MRPINPVLVDTLTQAVVDLQALPPNDRHRLVSIGVILETVLAAVPAEGRVLDPSAGALIAPAGRDTEVRVLLDRCLEELQALYLEREPALSERDEAGGCGSDEDSLLPEFLIECGETMDRLDRDLVALEQYPADRDILFRIFRTLHTIKGNAGCLGFSQLEALAHAGEELLGRLLDGELAITPAIISALLALVDAIRAILASLAASGAEGNREDAALIETVTRLRSHPAEHAPAAPAYPRTTPAPPTSVGYPVELSAPLLASIPTAPLGDHRPRGAGARSAGPGPGRRRLGDVLLQQGCLHPAELARALEQQERGDQRRLGDMLVELGMVQPEQLQSALQLLAEARTPGLSDHSIRVQVPHLEALGVLVGELGTVRNQIVAAAHGPGTCGAGAGLPGLAATLDRTTTALQHQLGEIRLRPIGTGWSKFPRLVRDLALASDKQVQLEMEGRETLIDTTLLAAIKDCLLHLLRNGVDHGIEAPAVRLARGKPAEGRLCLRAAQEGRQLTLEITDDGAGIDPERIRQRAVERGLLTAAAAAVLPEEELRALIFQPGFSTAEQVTPISGRGVGMDVVKSNIEQIGGTLEIDSRPGVGTTFRIQIALAPALLCLMEGERSAAGEGKTSLGTMYRAAEER